MIIVLDYESGNLRSISNALNYLDIRHIVVKSISEIKSNFTHIILPGVGSYNDAISNLRKKKFDKFLFENKEKNIPILGICVGMQIMSTIGYENKETDGLNFISGVVKNISELNPDYSCHVGWNNIIDFKNSPIFKNINLSCEFYFDHSYFFKPKKDENILCKSRFNLEYCSGIIEKNTIGLQFHPEKSHKNGIMIYKNFYNLFHA